ncbi:MAG: alpha/beta hydrolase [Pseudomonadaceae bacterium]|nr:alpha/beta hydrolase [Pseudomonadaceae bacterium]
MSVLANIEPRLGKISLGDIDIAYAERGQRSDAAPSLLFVHATGFHGRLWDRIASAFPNSHSICVDQRGHGRSSSLAVDHWQTFGNDLIEFIDALELDSAIGIGHSMGGHSLTHAAARRGVFNSLLLLDPTIASPDDYAGASSYPDQFASGHPAARRRNRFASPEEMRDRLVGKGSFGRFAPEILDDYCRYGLTCLDDASFELCCRPEVEAAVYVSARSNGAIHEAVAQIDAPVTVVRAEEPPPERDVTNFAYSPTWPALADRFSKGRDIYWPDSTHFIPMQHPERIIKLIDALL